MRSGGWLAASGSENLKIYVNLYRRMRVLQKILNTAKKGFGSSLKRFIQFILKDIQFRPAVSLMILVLNKYPSTV